MYHIPMNRLKFSCIFLVFLVCLSTIDGSDVHTLCAAASSKLKKVTHYHLHKTGGITINSILMSRYGGGQLHGPDRPKLNQALKSSPNSFYITYVRDPIAALLSRFYYWRACAVNKSYHLESNKFRKVMCQSLDTYMRTEASHNFMFDSLITGAPIGRCQGNTTNQSFERPRNLKRGATWSDVCHSDNYEDFTHEIENVLWSYRERVFVGITEQFDESLLLFGEQGGFQLGISNLTYCPKNLVMGGIKKSDLPADTLSMMQSRNQLDYALLTAAEKVLKRRKECAGGIKFDKRFETFKNKLLAFQSNNNCEMSYLKSTNVSALAKRKFKVEFLPPKLANPEYVDMSHKICRRGSTNSSSTTVASSEVISTRSNGDLNTKLLIKSGGMTKRGKKKLQKTPP